MQRSKKNNSAVDYRGRFAPSPTGYLHLGSLVSALASWLDARCHGGEWLLRIDDIDPPRDDPQAKASFATTLKAHGLEWDGPVIYQSRRFDRYREALRQLDSYPCSCSRKQIAQRGGHGDDCASTQPPFAIRLRSHNEVLWRRDDAPSYHLASSVDEIELGITHVVRGADLAFADQIQTSIIRQLGATPPQWRSVPLVTSDNGQKLSKQSMAPALRLDCVESQLKQALDHLLPGPNWAGSIDQKLSQALSLYKDIHAA